LYNHLMTDEVQPRKKRRRSNQLSSMQVMFAAILAVGLLLAISLSNRITASQPLQEAYNRALAEIEQLQREQAELIAERDYVRSDAFVERWARDDGKMVRPDEVLVIPVPAAGSLPQPQPTTELSVAVETTPPRPESWQVWWALFFDQAPPQLNP